MTTADSDSPLLRFEDPAQVAAREAEVQARWAEIALRLEPVIEAWRRGSGTVPSGPGLGALDRLGATVEQVDRITRIARDALGVEGTPGTAVAASVHALAWELTLFGERLRRSGWPDQEDVYAWLEVAAMSPVCRAPKAYAHEVTMPFTAADLRMWHGAQLPAGLAALAYAAGMRRAEAVRQAQAGTLDADGLRLLAALRTGQS